MSTSKPQTSTPDSTPPTAVRVANSVQPGAPGVSLEETIESNVEKMVKEYGPPVVTAILVVVLAASGWAFYVSRQESQVSNQWDGLNVGVGARNATSLQSTADSARGTFVGAVATNLSGIVDLNAALEKMVRDPEKAREEVRASMDRFKQVVDYPHSTDLIKQQAKYALAFAHEALGEFDAARPLYEELAAAKDSPLERFAKDGVGRCQDPAVRAFQEQFATWKPSSPGTAPNFDINTPSLDLIEQLKNLDKAPPVPTNPGTENTGANESGAPKQDPAANQTPSDGAATSAPATPETVTPAAEAPAGEKPPVELPPVLDLPKQD